jgi:hypothetical protein
VRHKFLSTAAEAATARDRRKKNLLLFFVNVLCLFIGKKHDLSKKNPNFEVNPILSKYSIYEESKNLMR